MGEIAIVSARVVVTVAAEDADAHGEAVFAGCFEEAVEGFERKGVIALVASGHDGEKRQVVSILMDDQVVIAIAEYITALVGIVTPFGGGR